jgi:hypothetical protein
MTTDSAAHTWYNHLLSILFSDLYYSHVCICNVHKYYWLIPPPSAKNIDHSSRLCCLLTNNKLLLKIIDTFLQLCARHLFCVTICILNPKPLLDIVIANNMTCEPLLLSVNLKLLCYSSTNRKFSKCTLNSSWCCIYCCCCVCTTPSIKLLLTPILLNSSSLLSITSAITSSTSIHEGLSI